MADEQTRSLADIVKELELQSLASEIMVDTLEGFNPILNSSEAKANQADLSAFIDIMSTVIFSINDNIRDLVTTITGGRLQEEENRRELIDALNNIGTSNNTPEPVPINDSNKKGPADWLMNFGVITGIGASFGVFAGFMSEMFSFLKGADGIINKLLRPIKSMGASVINTFKRIGSKLDELADILGNLFKTNKYTKPLADIIEFIKTSTKSSNIFFSKINDAFIKLGKSFTWGAKLGSMLGKLLKVIAYPITIILATIATVMGAIKGWKEGGLIGAIKGGLTGLLVNLVGEIVDLLKDGVSWIAKILGFENFSKALDGFSFSTLLETGVNAIFDTVVYVWDYLMKLFSPDKFISAFDDGGFAGIFALMGGGLLDMIKGAVSWLALMLGEFDLAKTLDDFSIQDYLLKAVHGMVDFVASMIQTVIDIFESAPAKLAEGMSALTDMSTNFAKAVLKSVLPVPSQHESMMDPLHWVSKAIPNSIYEFVNTKAPDQASNNLGGSKPNQSGIATPGITSGNPQFDSEVLKVQDYIKGSPSSAGNTLTNAGSSISNQPVVINNIGGSVTNTNTSQVNNNSSTFDLITPGSSMGFSSF